VEYDRLSLDPFLVYQIFPHNYTHTVALSMGKMVKFMYPLYTALHQCVYLVQFSQFVCRLLIIIFESVPALVEVFAANTRMESSDQRCF